MTAIIAKIVRPRAIVLGLVFFLANTAATIAPEPCSITYPVWRASLRAGRVGVWFRDLGVVKSGVAACDERYR